MFFVWMLLIVPGMIALYALVIRGLLHKVPALQDFYSKADGFWAKVWAICGNSLTIVWAHILGGIGSTLEMLGPIASVIGDDNFKNQIQSFQQYGMDPKAIGGLLIAISVITTAARLRGITRGS